jgi:hypothetical protein
MVYRPKGAFFTKTYSLIEWSFPYMMDLIPILAQKKRS